MCHRGLRVALTTAMLVASSFTSAQEYPSKPITLIVPFSAGGPTDTVGRLIAEAIGAQLKQQVVIQNVQGAGGTSGTLRVARAPADGYTLLLYHIGQATALSLYPKLAYHPIDDFEPIGLVTDVPMTLVARKNFPASDLKGVLDYAKTHKLIYAHAGVASASHLCGLLFQSAAGVQLISTRYNGTGPAMQDLVDGQVDVMCDQTTNTIDEIKTGKIKVYGVTTAKRLASLPDVPTMHEAGLRNFEIAIWHGLYAPKGTPRPIIEKLAHALRAAVQDAKVKQRFAELGTEPVAPPRATPEALRAHLKAEIDRWERIFKKAGVRAE